MARRRKESDLDALLDFVSLLPWWVGVVLAIVSYFVLSYFANIEAPTPANLEEFPRAIGTQVIRAVSTIGQYLLPAIFLIGAFGSAIGRMKRRKLISDAATDTDGSAVRSMSWQQFEMLVGEAFRMQGYVVTETGGGGADGGVDLKLGKGSETFLVQCKHWRAQKVSVKVVRELYGVVSAQGATGGIVVTSGAFTSDAKSFADGRNIELIDGPVLKQMIDKAQANHGEAASVHADPGSTVPQCPRCGRAMTRRKARRGPNAGKSFWGCSDYPRCRGTRPID